MTKMKVIVPKSEYDAYNRVNKYSSGESYKQNRGRKLVYAKLPSNFVLKKVLGQYTANGVVTYEVEVKQRQRQRFARRLKA